MAYDVVPTSKEWKEIMNIKDEDSQSRCINRYVYDLENQINFQELEIKSLNNELKKIKKQVLALDLVVEAVRKAKSEAYSDCNTDWSGFQGGA